MALSAGTRLGPYEILSVLGAGGMGEVYRARDLRLNREVALKVLPEEFALDADRLRRFQREAQVLASLNHSNIGAIYGLEETDGRQALVLELVEGPTLADVIATGTSRAPAAAATSESAPAARVGVGPHAQKEMRRGAAASGGGAPRALSMDEALPIARQICDALEAAHEHGIIHRDLKPANIKLRPDGTVKVLDFGLAKALEGETGAADVSQSPTLSVAATRAGIILGTAAYMSPEQARGKAVDKRADIWAFGCVLYEMLTGRRAFDGQDLTDTIAAVVRGEPDWSALPGDVPPVVRTLIKKCLEKDRKQRIADISTAQFLLNEGASLAPAGALTASPSPATMVPRPPLWWRVATPAATLLLGSLVAGATVWFATRPSPPRVARVPIPLSGVAALTTTGNDRDLAVAPDGTRIVYVGNNGALFVRSMDQLEPTPVVGVGGVRNPFFSPDGQWIGFFDGAWLKKVPVTGGPPITLCPIPGNPRGGTWSTDGTIIFATNDSSSGLWRVSAGGGEPTIVTKPARGESDHLWPEFLPGGRAVLFTIMAAGPVDNAQVAVLDLQTGAQKIVVRGGSHAQYVSTGHLVYGSTGTLRAVAFNLDRLEVTSTPVVVLQDVVTTGFGAANFDIARDGTLAYVGGGLQAAGRTLVWVDRQGIEEPIKAPLRTYWYPRLSPDGTRVALDIRDQESDIWIWDFGRETLTRLTFDPASDRFPVWTPDGRHVVFGSDRTGNANLFWQSADGTGTAERLTKSPNLQLPQAVSPDGSRLVLRENSPTTDLALLLLTKERPSEPAQTSTSALRQAQTGAPSAAAALGSEGVVSPSNHEAQPLLRTSFIEQNAEISPDGRWMVYESNDSGQFEVFVRPFPNVDSGRWQISTGGGAQPLWARSGQELFYLLPTGGLMSVRVEGGPTWSAGTPTKVFEGRYFQGGGAAAGFGRTYDVSPDGRRFLMIKQGGGSDQTAALARLVVVFNWFEELKRLVPTTR